MPAERVRILFAEDDSNLGFLLKDFLSCEGFDVVLCDNGEKALKTFVEEAFTLCLLDVMMPKLDGLTLLKEIRAINNVIPVVLITARSMKEDKLKGYDFGADDYIVKPFDEEELLWKIKALLRRVENKPNSKDPKFISIGRYSFDYENQSLLIHEKLKRITEKESDLLYYLFQNRNKVIRREDILKELWGENDYFLGRSLDVFITKIRKYLNEDPEISIENVYKVGFIFNVPK